MKTGRLLKFHRPSGDIHAYLYREGSQFRAALYVMTPEGSRRQPVHDISGASEARVEEDVRSWVESHFPRPR
jgi:hypothetical protein